MDTITYQREIKKLHHIRAEWHPVIEVRKVTGKKMLKEFIFLPEKLHKGHKFWTPPLYNDEWKYFDSSRNPSFAFSDVILFLAYFEGRAVGRIMGIINTRYNQIKNEKNARFSNFETEDNIYVARALLESVENWALHHGMKNIVGPLGFTDQEPEGFIVEGFDEDTTIATYYNYSFIPVLLEQNGYTKEVDYVSYKVLPVIPEVYKKISGRLQNRDYKLIEFRKKKEIKKYIIPILSLMNVCFTEIYGYTPLNMAEMATLAKQYFMLIDKRFLKIVVKDGEVIGFAIAMPNMSEGLRKSKGYLLPFGLFYILRSAKKSKQLDLLLGGVHPKYQKLGIDVLLGTAMIRTAIENGFTIMDSHLELETNLKIRAEMERAGGKVYRRYRIFQKSLES
jgi:GNAT superfamily N-acetyltransferase